MRRALIWIRAADATNPKLKEGKVREINPDYWSVFTDFGNFGRVFAENGDFLTF